ncbi:hypothetical protein [Roseateles chitinivorans]|uniref:hypothetical protein n=1 Tax=Roseateles chitinivorans TaxID=2917965 RepID=UPI003D6702A5
MQEIRVAWLFGLHESQAGEPTAGGIWFPDNEANRRQLEIIVEAGNDACGSGTHWLEERTA